MPRDIFSDVAQPRASLRSQAWYTLPVSILTHGVLVALVIGLPLLAPDLLPQPPTSLVVIAAPALPRDLPPEPPQPKRMGATTPSTSATPANRTAAPVEAGDRIAAESAAPPGPPDVTFAGGGPPASGFGGTLTGISAPAPPPAAAPPQPVRPGGLVRYPQKIRDVQPVYPQVAIVGKVQGRVTIDAIIATDGTVRDMRVIKSVPLLDRAALDAVRQWRFTPTLLNGVPVPVLLTINVDFRLQ